jgi:hypothetical protein
VLIACAILTGIATAIVARWTTPRSAWQLLWNRIYARLLELRLFFDEPGLVWRAQAGILRENVRLMLLVLPTLLILAAPATWLYMRLDAIYSVRPLRAGDVAVVTGRLDDATEAVEVRASGPVRVESPPVRVPREQQVAWRIRISGTQPFTLRYVRKGRPAPLRIEYPPAAGIHWTIWFFIVSTLSAVLTLRIVRR